MVGNWSWSGSIRRRRTPLRPDWFAANVEWPCMFSAIFPSPITSFGWRFLGRSAEDCSRIGFDSSG